MTNSLEKLTLNEETSLGSSLQEKGSYQTPHSRKNNETYLGFLSNYFDSIYTPGSMIRSAKENPSILNYTVAVICESTRAMIYSAFATINPLIPAGLITTGILGYLFKKLNKEKK